MSKNVKTVSQMKKATKLVNRTFHKYGPKSYKSGQGALLKVLNKSVNREMSEKDLVEKLHISKRELKNVARKAKKNGYVDMSMDEGKHGFKVSITPEGSKIAEKRCEAHSKVADKIFSVLNDEELQQLNNITEKLIVQCKDMGAHGKSKGHHKGHCHHKRHCHK